LHCGHDESNHITDKSTEAHHALGEQKRLPSPMCMRCWRHRPTATSGLVSFRYLQLIIRRPTKSGLCPSALHGVAGSVTKHKLLAGSRYTDKVFPHRQCCQRGGGTLLVSPADAEGA
jgi:hypothetical protein